MEFLLIPPLIIVVILLSIYPIYKLYQHLKITKASNWAWFGFIILMLKFCSANHTETVYKDSPKSVNTATSDTPYFSGITTKPFGNIKYLSIQFDNSRVRNLNILLKNDGWFEEKTDPFIKTTDIENVHHSGDDLIIDIYKVNVSKIKMIPYTSYEGIDIKIKCSLVDGKCRVIEGNKEYYFDTDKVE
ncbi:MAG: hypothetical protein MUF45_08950 [Spirosomaceae bacterium]|jgi:hypothetical protein|nr:hypothetical protein [Spirosomataceae bacterium]